MYAQTVRIIKVPKDIISLTNKGLERKIRTNVKITASITKVRVSFKRELKLNSLLTKEKFFVASFACI